MKNRQVSLLGMYLSSYEKCKHLHFWLMFFSTTEESPMKFYYFLAKTFTLSTIRVYCGERLKLYNPFDF